jgi:predicted metalloprotease
MRWQGRRESTNVEDRRGRYVKPVVGGGIGTLIIALAIYLLGGDPSSVIETSQIDDSAATSTYQGSEAENDLVKFTKVVLAETEDTWTEVFRKQGREYEAPILVLYSGAVQSACGISGASTGPFYCPGDSKLYMDLSFLQELQRELNAPGDFAMAYVIAHEVGHHIQKLLGIEDQLASIRSRVSQEEYNRYSVRCELQADYLSGVWANHAKRSDLLEEGDLEEALNAASAVGDDRIQRQQRGYVVPESFTHGTADQRKRWFTRGFQTGDLSQGDTFNATSL